MKHLPPPILTQKEQKILFRWKAQRKEGWKRERAIIIIEFWLGKSSHDIARLVQRSVATVLKWYHRFQEDRYKGLCDKERKGRSPRLDTQQQKDAISFLCSSPRDFGHDTDKWCPLLWQQTLKTHFLVNLSERTARRLRKKHRVRWIRSKRWIRSGDPRYEYRKAQILAMRALAEMDEDAELIYIDEFGPFGIRPHYGERMQIPGTIKHLIPEHFDVKGDVRLYGGYCWKENRVLVWECEDETFNGQHTISFLKWLLPQLAHRRRVYLVWDNAGWHISELLRRWLQSYNAKARFRDRPSVRVLQLPSKAPWLNPIEAVWRAMRKNALHSVSFESRQQVIGAIMTYFEHRNARFHNKKRRVRKPKIDDVAACSIE